MDELLEELFNAIFDDYASTGTEWLDFEDYQKRAKKRMWLILGKFRNRLLKAIINEHYDRYEQ